MILLPSRLSVSVWHGAGSTRSGIPGSDPGVIGTPGADLGTPGTGRGGIAILGTGPGDGIRGIPVTVPGIPDIAPGIPEGITVLQGQAPSDGISPVAVMAVEARV